MNKIHLLLQMSDSAFPVGSFSFSCGLETAASQNIVHSTHTLEQYTLTALRQSAYTDGIAAITAYRAALVGNYGVIASADHALTGCKMNSENRLMLERMGKKAAELGVRLFSNNGLLKQWLADIKTLNVPGNYPIAQGLLFAAAGLSEYELFASHVYGVVNMILSAALRCVRVSHFDTQAIHVRLSSHTDTLYEDVQRLAISDMRAFAPQADVLASMHEKGTMRMFMN
jgi:urease accessory protein